MAIKDFKGFGARKNRLVFPSSMVRFSVVMLFSRFMKVLIVASLLGFCCTLADIHMDDFASSEQGEQTDSCCVTCCPAHNLGPSVSLLDAAPIEKIDCEFPVEITFSSEEIIASVFHPPRPAA